MKNILLLVLLIGFSLVGCSNQGDDRLAEKAKIEGREQAKQELQAQLDAKDQLVEKARAEGKAQAEEQLKVQIDNVDKLKKKSYAEGKATAEAEYATQKENVGFLIERARNEGKAQAEAQLKTQNDNLAKKAQEMEADLALRNKFYQAVRGTYEGNLATERGNFKIRITLIPSLPPYDSGRTRTLEEVTADLINLYFNAQVMQWNPENQLGAVGCRVERIRPDITTGEISIASEACKNLYSIKLSGVLDQKTNKLTSGDGSISDSEEGKKKLSRTIAAGIKKGTLNSVPVITGKLQPTTNAQGYQFSAERVEQ